MTDRYRIDALGAKADGVHKGDEAVFIEGALPGEVVEATVARADDGTLRGAVTAVVAASPDRVNAPCPHYDVCGGCSLQHASEGFYREWKQAIVRDALAKKRSEEH